jgi:hypothetical protein
MLNAFFFSPRLFTSRFQVPVDLLVSNAAVRKEIARDLVSTIGLGTSILSLASLSGAATVSLNPTSPDFGKVKIGNQRIDFWGGWQQLARYISQASVEGAKGVGVVKGDSRVLDVVGRFLRSKLSPVAGLGADVLTGETFLGEEFRPSERFAGEQAINRLAPLFWQDVYESIREEGVRGGILAAPGFLGVTVTAYQPRITQELEQIDQYRGLPNDDRREILGQDGFLDRVQAERRDAIRRGIPQERVASTPVEHTIRELGRHEGKSPEFIEWAVRLNKDANDPELLNPDWLDFVIENQDELREDAPWLFDQWLEEFLRLNPRREVVNQ